MCTINDSFIQQWHPLYDTTENDEQDYQDIIRDVKREVSAKGTITKPVFIRILEWKAARLKGIVKLNQYDTYAETIRSAIQSPEKYKLTMLTSLYGIGVPLASTILHFIYPEDFPIMDIRTAEVLHCGHYIESVQRDEKHYPPFRAAILGIKRQYPQWSLRQIDRALFAYHKINSNQCISSSQTVARNNILASKRRDTNDGTPEEVINMSLEEHIRRFRQRSDSGRYASLTDNQQKLYAVTKELSQGNKDKVLKKADIKEKFTRTYPNEVFYESERNMLTDFCYNKVNKDDKPNKFLFSVKRGEFRFVDFDWDIGEKVVDVFWDIRDLRLFFKVGYYSHREFVWDFDELLKYIGANEPL